MDAAMDYRRQIIADMDFNKRQFKGKLPIRLLAVADEHSIPNMGELLKPYFENVTSLVVANSAHFVPEETAGVARRRARLLPQWRIVPMSAEEKWVTTTETFVAAVKDQCVKRVVISGRLANAPSNLPVAGPVTVRRRRRFRQSPFR